MNYSLVKNLYTYVEVKNHNNTTVVAKKHGYGINLEAAGGCVNLVIPGSVPKEQAKEQAQQFGFEITGVVKHY
ncbi:hypothetical protein [Aeromonas phage AerS_266]|nr:hypothetical protein [Aeromonas phage AerS_266]